MDSDESIRPGMTTSNRILTFTQDDVLTIPLEAVYSKDSLKYAYIKSGFSIEKREIELGESNNDVVIINKGLNENDVVYLSEPEGLETKSIKLID